MIVFTTLEHWNRRGVSAQLSRRYGRDYQVVLINREPIDELRRQLPPSKAKRVVDALPTREDVVLWLRHHDGPGVPWPKYAIEGI